ncbi:Reticulon-like protein B9 [Dendrobium catenatum]|uniref:Reticulon-like protein B9 n=1 Tax=Dendrobium catenatum TaxID=906689 RepID=A0A2I0XDH1_9ASPA|nr:Reticulon-like protein B9 [Dendrobium catenatum]
MLQSPFGVRRDIDDSRCPVRVRTVKSPFGVHGQGIAGIAASRTRRQPRYLCIQILPVLYENYEGEVDHLVTEGSRSLRKLYRKFDSKVLNKIPRGPVKDQKHI